ncbi:UNVERIFIED_CONTAM: F-box protein PP2-A13 [Sesamum calycinum]|uniref:F-box protein PP2-A13 n=1 Tax=Sesamum calycinum TaxID=2727403 RepID=A0AAW2LYZ0_9LAMI
MTQDCNVALGQNPSQSTIKSPELEKNLKGKTIFHYFILAFHSFAGDGLIVFVLGSEWKLRRRRFFEGDWVGDLPESCVASVLSYLDPPQICRVAMLNRAFRGASSADFVWESKLPLNYEDVIGRVFEKDGVSFKGLCKRDIYARLCRPNSFDGGTKRVWLDKTTGKTCMLIASNGLAITGIDDRRYWTRIPTEESRFYSVAYLQQIWWLELYGRLSSHSQQDHTVSSSDCNWDAFIRGLGVAFVTPSMFMAGIKSLQDSSFQLPMVRKKRNNVT